MDRTLPKPELPFLREVRSKAAFDHSEPGRNLLNTENSASILETNMDRVCRPGLWCPLGQALQQSRLVLGRFCKAAWQYASDRRLRRNAPRRHRFAGLRSV